MCSIHHHSMPLRTWAVCESNILMKLRYARENSFPKISSVSNNLGAQLADVFFSQLSKETQEKIGLIPILEGPGDDLWVSPSEQLVGHLNLKPPLTRRYQQAVSHGGILEIGDIALAKAEYENQCKLNEALRQKEIEVIKYLAHLFTNIVARTRYEEKEKYEIKLKAAIEQMKKYYEELMRAREIEIMEKAKKAMEATTKMMRECFQEEVSNTLAAKEDFLAKAHKFQVQWKECLIREEYITKGRELEKRWDRIFKRFEDSCEAEKHKLKALIETESHAFTMNYILEERQKAKQNLEEVEESYNRRISDLMDQLENQDDEILKLKNEKEIKDIELASWICLLRDLVQQFQKFISFTMKEKPAGAQYLLNLDQLLENRESIFKKETLPKLVKKRKGSKVLMEFWKKESVRSSKTLLDSEDVAEISRESITGTVTYERPESGSKLETAIPSDDALSAIKQCVGSLLPNVKWAGELEEVESFTMKPSSEQEMSTAGETWESVKSLSKISMSSRASKRSLRRRPPAGRTASKKSTPRKPAPAPKKHRRRKSYYNSEVILPRRVPEMMALNLPLSDPDLAEDAIKMREAEWDRKREKDREVRLAGDDVSQVLSVQEFVNKRLGSILDILTEHPSLMRVIIKP